MCTQLGKTDENYAMQDQSSVHGQLQHTSIIHHAAVLSSSAGYTELEDNSVGFIDGVFHSFPAEQIGVDGKWHQTQAMAERLILQEQEKEQNKTV